MEEWKEYRLGEIATFSQGIQVDIKSQFLQKEEGYIRFVRIVDYTKQGEEQPRYIQRPNDRYIVSETDLVMIRYGSQTAGKIVRGISGAIANNTFKVILNQNVALNNFVYYYLSQNSIREYFMRSQASSTMPAITFEMMRNLKVALPTLQTQQKIASILSSLDDKIDVNRRINEQLEELAQALFKSWFVDFEPFKDGEFVESELGMIPKGWKVGNLLDVAELFDSQRKPLSGRERDAMQKIYPYYGATSIMDYVDNYIFDGVYLLMGEDGSVVNEKGFPFLQYVWGKFWPNNHAHVMQGKNGYTTEMLHTLLSITNVQAVVTGAVQAKISQTGMKKIPVIIANKGVLDDFSEKVTPIYNKIRANSEEITHLTTLRDTLLPKLMSGEIDVNEVEI